MGKSLRKSMRPPRGKHYFLLSLFSLSHLPFTHIFLTFNFTTAPRKGLIGGLWKGQHLPFRGAEVADNRGSAG